MNSLLAHLAEKAAEAALKSVVSARKAKKIAKGVSTTIEVAEFLSGVPIPDRDYRSSVDYTPPFT